MLLVLEDRVLALAWQEGRIGLGARVFVGVRRRAGHDSLARIGPPPEHEVVAMVRDMAESSARWAKSPSARLMPAPVDSDPRRTEFRAEQIVNIDYPERERLSSFRD